MQVPPFWHKAVTGTSATNRQLSVKKKKKASDRNKQSLRKLTGKKKKNQKKKPQLKKKIKYSETCEIRTPLGQARSVP
jgi:hypothetical protein